MSSLMPFSFNAVELHVATINEKPWARAREVCKALEYGKATKAIKTVKHLCSRESYAYKYQLNEFVSETDMDWPKDSRKDDCYLNEEGMYEIVFSNQQPKTKDFRRHCFNVLFPHVQQQLSDKLHAMEIEDLTNRFQALGFTNEEECQAHQPQILRLNEDHRQSIKEKEQEIDGLIKNKHVARRGYFENVLCFIKKNSKEAHLYYVIRCQYRQFEKHKIYLKLRYPNMEKAGRYDDPNVIHRWIIFKCEVIEKPNYYKNHFSLTEENREVLETILDVTI